MEEGRSCGRKAAAARPAARRIATHICGCDSHLRGTFLPVLPQGW